MEQSASAVNWQPRNIPKQPGELMRNSLQHVARGADGILFFQWRASRAGAEKFHAALVPHAGTDTRVWREVVELSRTLDRLDEVVGSHVENEVALLVDYEAWWACELDSHPSVDVRYLDRPHAVHAALTDLGVGVDVVHPDTDLGRYRLVVVPTLYSVTDETAARIDAAVRAGATALVTYFSGITDEHDHIRLGGYPGAFRDLLGIRVEELVPLRQGHEVSLSDGSRGGRLDRAARAGRGRGRRDVRRRARARRPRRHPAPARRRDRRGTSRHDWTRGRWPAWWPGSSTRPASGPSPAPDPGWR